MNIQIISAEGCVKASAAGEEIRLLFREPYETGDKIVLSSEKPVLAAVQLEDSLAVTYGLLDGVFVFPVPFGERRAVYSPKCFSGNLHLLCARPAYPWERRVYRNMALNPLDHHGNTALFPHASANVETRGEAVFAAGNAVNGNVTSAGHGMWPFESWGINRREDAAFHVDFGREVCADRLVITLRADFPHDNWWKSLRVRFSDESVLTLNLLKSGLPQSFDIAPRRVRGVTADSLQKDENDPSPFPALVQLECWGIETDNGRGDPL